MFRRLLEWLALTDHERKVILFLAGTMLVGVGIRVYRSTFPNAPTFDYRATDSTFAALNQAVVSGSVDDTTMAEVERVELNSATKDALMSLEGIGSVTADRILQYRTEMGRFSQVEDLLHVKGISRRKLEKIRPYIIIH
jgi:competence ComEA-like helix-hairpin-helix protein